MYEESIYNKIAKKWLVHSDERNGRRVIMVPQTEPHPRRFAPIRAGSVRLGSAPIDGKDNW
ncbi:hypothetical protein [Streptomyces sp. NPDC002550]